MKNNKGFTLVEIISVVVILSLIALLITPIVSKIIKDNGQKTYDDQIKGIIASAKTWGADHMNGLPGEISKLQSSSIISAAKTWASYNPGLIPEEGDSDLVVTLKTLQNANYISNDLENPSTGKPYDSEHVKIVIKNLDGEIVYSVIQEEVTITLEDLQSGGYSKTDLKNPDTNELFDPVKTKIIITNNNGNLIYKVEIEE